MFWQYACPSRQSSKSAVDKTEITNDHKILSPQRHTTLKWWYSECHQQYKVTDNLAWSLNITTLAKKRPSSVLQYEVCHNWSSAKPTRFSKKQDSLICSISKMIRITVFCFLLSHLAISQSWKTVPGVVGLVYFSKKVHNQPKENRILRKMLMG